MPKDWYHRYYPDPIEHVDGSQSSATHTVTNTGAAFELAGVRELLVTHSVSAISGAGATITLELELSIDGTSWWSAGSLAAQTANGSVTKGFSTPATKGRWKRTIAGTTPSVTDSVKAEFRD